MSTGALAALPFGAWAQNKSKIKGRFVHMVFFWLKEETNVSEFIKGTEEFLQKVEVIQAYHLGTPAGTPREVVDNSYTVCLVVTFDTKEAQDVYQVHPAHLDYVEQNKHKWSVVKIFDSWGEG